MSNLNVVARTRISFLLYFVSSAKFHLLLIMNLNMEHGESRKSSFYKACSKISKEDGSEDKEMATVDNETQTRPKQKGKMAGSIQRLNLTSCKQITSTSKPKRRKIKLMNWKKFHRLKVIYDFLDDLERDYPAICTVSVIGKSVEGRDIKMLKVSNSNAKNLAVWLDASIHSREWISTAVVTYLADYLVKNFKTHPVYITNKDWHMVPVLNPDGYEHSHTHDRMWRKNRAKHEGACVGVDLNRNFSHAWGNNGEEGSSEDPNNIFYRGPAPFSEPETVAVRDAILCSSSKFKVFLSFHSYYELIIFPWGYKRDPCPNYLHLLEGAAVMSRAIFEYSGVTYKVGSTKDMTYYACGTSTDWSYAKANIPYSYMIELRSRKYKFKLPKDQIIENCVEIWCAVKSLMNYVEHN